MSILIKGMKMPTAQQGCMTIRIYRDGKCVSHPQGTLIKGVEAVEVRTPHGRLIDADALTGKAYMDGKLMCVEMDDIEEAPTIIDPEEEIRALRMHIKDLEHHIEYLYDRRTIAELEGEIRGLKFSIMCNSVSGGEINAARR